MGLKGQEEFSKVGIKYTIKHEVKWKIFSPFIATCIGFARSATFNSINAKVIWELQCEGNIGMYTIYEKIVSFVEMTHEQKSFD